MVYKELLGFTGTIIAFIGYFPYFKDIFLHRTKPHAFSWLIWSILAGIIYFGQYADNAGPGAWVIGITTLFNFLIFLLALKYGENQIVLVDWLSLIGTSAALVLWLLTKEPFLSVVLITLIGIFGFLPTIRKAFVKPKEETVVTYALNIPKFMFALLALDNISIVTFLYPLTLLLMNGLLTCMLIIRRNKNSFHSKSGWGLFFVNISSVTQSFN